MTLKKVAYRREKEFPEDAGFGHLLSTQANVPHESTVTTNYEQLSRAPKGNCSSV